MRSLRLPGLGGWILSELNNTQLFACEGLGQLIECRASREGTDRDTDDSNSFMRLPDGRNRLSVGAATGKAGTRPSDARRACVLTGMSSSARF
jgi:hypothetical protein